MNRLTSIIFTTLLAVLIVSGLIAYVLRERGSQIASSRDENAVAVVAPDAGASQPGGEFAAPVPQPERGAPSIFSEMFAPAAAASQSSAQHTMMNSVGIALRFALAALLAALLAFRPRRGVPVHRRNPYVAQTQVLLAVVAAAMMIIVGDSAARAFGIFAAASLVSFRTNIRDPKDIAVLLVCLGVGLAAGVGRIDLGVVLSLFVLVTLTALELAEPRQAFRSMQVCVETRDIERTHEVLRSIFRQQGFSIELREINRACEENPAGKVVYHVKLNPVTDMDRLSEQIIAADRQNIGSVGWEQKKSTTYIYN